LNDPFKDPRFGENPTYSYLKIGDIMGYLEVPKVGIALPIYEGTSDAVLKRGSGWLEGSSLPVGGESTHTVLTGHNGLPTSRLFTDITKLEVGDEFFIRNFAEILAYRVVEIQVVEPHEVAGMGIVKGKDLATLLTCYPYMINSHRLLVTGERIPYTGQLEQAAQDAQGFNFLANLTPVQRNFVLTIVGTLAVLIIFIILGILAYRRQRKRGKTDGS
jgi:sortase A